MFKKVVFGFFDVFEEIVVMGKLVGGVVLDFFLDWLMVVVGFYVKDFGKIDESFYELVKIVEKEFDFLGVNWNVDEYEGIMFYIM